MLITAATCAQWGKFPIPTDPDELALLERVVAAVVEHITTHYMIDDPATDTQEQAMLLQVSRLWRRRDNPDGMVAFEDLGAMRLSRVDPDVKVMLSEQVNFA